MDVGRECMGVLRAGMIAWRAHLRVACVCGCVTCMWHAYMRVHVGCVACVYEHATCAHGRVENMVRNESLLPPSVP